MALPTVLMGDDRKFAFVRADLVRSEDEARAYVLEHEGIDVSDYEAARCEMLPVPEHFIGIPYEWAIVVPGTRGAAEFWRFEAVERSDG